MKWLCLAVVCTLSTVAAPVHAQWARLEPHRIEEFAPATGQRFPIRIVLDRRAQIELRLLTTDGDPVRALRSAESLEPGSHELQWDGKDDTGVVVPDEAYVPVLVARAADGTTLELDPRAATGGEVIDQLQVAPGAGGDIGYVLPAPARVLVRVGIKEGPMLASLANWEPRASGKNVQRWNGFDQDQLLDLRRSERLSVLVTAFKLPAHSIITTGNTAMDYRAYRKSKGWREDQATIGTPVLDRNGVRIARSFFQPQYKQADPAVMLQPLGAVERGTDGVLRARDSLRVQVDIPEADRWLMQESLYEVAFFIDNEFVSEEEHGYVPITWLWSPSQLKPGRHMLTVNVSGFGGKVAVKSLLFDVPAD
jgi:hypothetical protein